MPVPTPNKGETMDAYMGRCMPFMVNDNKGKAPNAKRPQKQMVAICMSQFRKGMASLKEDKNG